MSRTQQVELIPREDTNALMEWLQEAARQVRLAWRLFWDLSLIHISEPTRPY